MASGEIPVEQFFDLVLRDGDTIRAFLAAVPPDQWADFRDRCRSRLTTEKSALSGIAQQRAADTTADQPRRVDASQVERLEALRLKEEMFLEAVAQRPG